MPLPTRFDSQRVFWFEAQTAIFRDLPPLAPSNFHQFCLPRTQKNLERVSRMMLNAKSGPHGLEYAQADLDWLNANDLPPHKRPVTGRE